MRRAGLFAGVLAALLGIAFAWAIPALGHTGRPTISGRAAVPRASRAATTPTAASDTSPILATDTSPIAATDTATAATAARPSTRATGSTTTAVTDAGAAASADTAPAGRWSAPTTLYGPAAADLIPPVVATSAADALAVGSGHTDEDDPARARAALITGTGAHPGQLRQSLSATQQTLAVGWLGGRLVLLNGSSTPGLACCSTATLQSASGHSLAAAQTLAGGLEGTSTGALVPVQGGLLAVLDNQAGITVARSDATAAFADPQQLVGSDPTPPLMAAGSLSDGGALVAWTATASAAQTVTGTSTTPGTSASTQGYDQPENRRIEFATTGTTGPVGSTRLAVTVPAGREIDALAVVPHGRGATLAWTESWFANLHAYRSAIFFADIGAGGSAGHISELTGTDSAAVGLSLAGSGDGREVLTWQACAISAGTCQVEAALRPAGGAWGPVADLGSVDPTAFPVAVQSRRGESLVGWIAGGVVQSASAAPGASDFSAPRRVSVGADASSLALSFGATRRAVAVWVQGTYDQKLVSAQFHG